VPKAIVTGRFVSVSVGLTMKGAALMWTAICPESSACTVTPLSPQSRAPREPEIGDAREGFIRDRKDNGNRALGGTEMVTGFVGFSLVPAALNVPTSFEIVKLAFSTPAAARTKLTLSDLMPAGVVISLQVWQPPEGGGSLPRPGWRRRHSHAACCQSPN
jgi:hypothetical protein